ncbi:MAG: hypothetical protein IPG85_16210 [Bacteroidetes bacterium]|nr:hypothetical protein [Bacteroidota bacterium]
MSTQRELQNLDKSKLKAVPEQLTSVETLDKISKARQEAEAYINSLLEKDENDESKGIDYQKEDPFLR